MCPCSGGVKQRLRSGFPDQRGPEVLSTMCEQALAPALLLAALSRDSACASRATNSTLTRSWRASSSCGAGRPRFAASRRRRVDREHRRAMPEGWNQTGSDAHKRQRRDAAKRGLPAPQEDDARHERVEVELVAGEAHALSLDKAANSRAGARACSHIVLSTSGPRWSGNPDRSRCFTPPLQGHTVGMTARERS
jgi:hypothetical protein